MENIILELESQLVKETQEHLDYAKDRQWKDFPSIQNYIDELEPFTDDEQTLWDQWYRKWYQAAIDKIKELNQ